MNTKLTSLLLAGTAAIAITSQRLRLGHQFYRRLPERPRHASAGVGGTGSAAGARSASRSTRPA